MLTRGVVVTLPENGAPLAKKMHGDKRFAFHGVTYGTLVRAIPRGVFRGQHVSG